MLLHDNHLSYVWLHCGLIINVIQVNHATVKGIIKDEVLFVVVAYASMDITRQFKPKELSM